jgi:hypothetical protein
VPLEISLRHHHPNIQVTKHKTFKKKIFSSIAMQSSAVNPIKFLAFIS